MNRRTTREANESRLSELYDTYAEPIYRYCFFRVFSKERAEELSQEVFLRAWRYMEEGKELEYPKALLYKIATHLVIDEKRKHHETSLDALLEDDALAEPTAPGGEAAVTHRAELREVREELAKLSPEEQELFSLRYVSDLDPKEIGEVLGVTPNVISVRLNRIMHKLKETFEPQP